MNFGTRFLGPHARCLRFVGLSRCARRKTRFRMATSTLGGGDSHPRAALRSVRRYFPPLRPGLPGAPSAASYMWVWRCAGGRRPVTHADAGVVGKLPRRRVAVPDARLVLVEGHVEHPVRTPSRCANADAPARQGARRQGRGWSGSTPSPRSPCRPRLARVRSSRSNALCLLGLVDTTRSSARHCSSVRKLEGKRHEPHARTHARTHARNDRATVDGRSFHRA
jgi:hypothetical protein